ncbi:MAG: hypothetical protein F9K30_14205 [Dechloromonas sp.]|nr:MAG: hypothetical protein F9K30_14205 [Dechloromonas sp.]
MYPIASPSPAISLAAIALGMLLFALSPVSLAADAAQPMPAGIEATAQTLDPSASYKEINLKELVARSRTELPGQRVIFAPMPIRFRATLAALPVAQKADYLLTALSMMKVSNPPRVSQRIGLDYGGDKVLSAYIEEDVARRLAREIKPGQMRTFYAYHVYNYSRGPALLVTSFAE